MTPEAIVRAQDHAATGGDHEDEAMRRAMEHALGGWEPPARSSPVAGNQPVAYTGSGSLAAIAAGREGFIWSEPAEAHPIPLYAEPMVPTGGTLRERILAILDGDEGFVVGKAWSDTKPTKYDRCVHGWSRADGCPACLDAAIRAALDADGRTGVDGAARSQEEVVR
jgi:hypothetical protein